jgi:AraC family transcriptional regulator
VPPGTTGSSEVGIMEMPGGKYAVASFELVPSEYGAAWNWFMGEWFPQSGFVPDDRPCFERCLNDPATHPERKHVVELWEPVRPL